MTSDLVVWAFLFVVVSVAVGDHRKTSPCNNLTTNLSTLPTSIHQNITTPESDPPSHHLLIEHTIFYHTVEISQPQWWNPWSKQLRLHVSRNVQMLSTTQFNALLGHAARHRVAVDSDNANDNSQVMVEVNAQILAPLDQFWQIIAQVIVPVVTVLLFLIGVIIEPLCNSSDIFAGNCLGRLFHSWPFHRGSPPGAELERNASFDRFYRRISTVISCEIEQGSVKEAASVKSREDSIDRLFARSRKSMKTLASWSSFESMQRQSSKSVKSIGHKFTFCRGKVSSRSLESIKSDPLRVKWN